MRSFVSSLGNDLGVWCSERHGCWPRISVHLHHHQFTPGTVTFYLLYCSTFVIKGSLGKRLRFRMNTAVTHGTHILSEKNRFLGQISVQKLVYIATSFLA